MVITEVFYGLKCDRCGELHEDGEHSFWSDENSAIENAYESDWAELKGKHYCTNCHEVNEETDEVVVYDSYPKYLKTLNGFIDRILVATRRDVAENACEFIVTFHLYNRRHLEDFEEDYIKSLLKENYVSIEYEFGKYNDSLCKVTLTNLQ